MSHSGFSILGPRLGPRLHGQLELGGWFPSKEVKPCANEKRRHWIWHQQQITITVFGESRTGPTGQFIFMYYSTLLHNYTQAIVSCWVVQFALHALCEKQLSTKVYFALGSTSHIDFQHVCNDWSEALIVGALLISLASTHSSRGKLCDSKPFLTAIVLWGVGHRLCHMM